MARRRTEEPAENHERWVVSYADFITLMFAFFTVLYATSEHNSEKAKEFERSIKQYLIKFGALGESGQKIDQSVEQNTPIESPIREFQKPLVQNNKDQKTVERLVLETLSSSQIEKYVKDISSDQWGVRLIVDSDQIFRRGSVQMRREALPLLDKMANVLKKSSRKIIVEGHSDDKPKLESLANSWELSSVQATRIARYLTQIHKIGTSRLAVMSYGAERPLPPSNRRIEFLILSEDLPF